MGQTTDDLNAFFEELDSPDRKQSSKIEIDDLADAQIETVSKLIIQELARQSFHGSNFNLYQSVNNQNGNVIIAAHLTESNRIYRDEFSPTIIKEISEKYWSMKPDDFNKYLKNLVNSYFIEGPQLISLRNLRGYKMIKLKED